MKRSYPVIKPDGSLDGTPEALTVWSIPAPPVHEVRGEMNTVGPWQIVMGYRALAVDKHGRVFGVCSLDKPRDSSGCLEGKVSIEGKKYRAFTSSRLFRRADGSLCDVATLYVCGTPDVLYIDPLEVPEDSRRDYLKSIQGRYHYERTGLYATLARYCTLLLWSKGPDYPEMMEHWAREAQQVRAELIAPMGWTRE